MRLFSILKVTLPAAAALIVVGVAANSVARAPHPLSQNFFHSGLISSEAFAVERGPARFVPHSDEFGTSVDPDKAKAYLEGRVSDWNTTHQCMSCHTSYSYALFSAMSPDSPSRVAKTLTDLMSNHTQNWDATRSWYGGSGDRKFIESKATESVLNFVMLAMSDMKHNNSVVNQVTRDAMALMIKTQNSDGSWYWLDFSLRPFEDSTGNYWGASLAAYALGSLPESERSSPEVVNCINQIKNFLTNAASNRALDLHNQAALLLASTKMPGLLNIDAKQALISSLKMVRSTDGGWSMRALKVFDASTYSPDPTQTSDGYATGYLTLVLREAGAAAEDLKPGIDWLKTHQRTDGTWPPGTMNSPLTSSGSSSNRNVDNGSFADFRTGIMTDLATVYALIGLQN